jgi:predicted metal-dependent RNase
VKTHYSQVSLKRVDSNEMRGEILNNHQEPCVVLATSGMMNGGPVMEYFKEWAQDKKNTIAFVGYQAEGTIGKKNSERLE